VTVGLPPYVQTGESHTAALFRIAAQSMIDGAGIRTSFGSGHFGAGGYQVSAPGGMFVAVAGGEAWVPGTLGSVGPLPANLSSPFNAYFGGYNPSFTNQGCYAVYNDGTVTLPIATASSQPRYDLVCLTVEDTDYGAGSMTALLQVITGTPGASPALPAMPASSLVLAVVSVPGSATSITSGDLSDYRPPLIPHQAPPWYAMAYQSATQSIPNNTNTPVGYQTLLVDPAQCFNTSAGSYLCPVAGVYRINAAVQLNLPSGGTGIAQLNIYDGVTLAKVGPQTPLVTAIDNPVISAGGMLLCAQFDEISVQVVQSTGGAVGTLAGKAVSFFDISLHQAI
jgi:hypothetical protein